MAGYDSVDHLLDYMIGMGFNRNEILRVLRALVIPEFVDDKFNRAIARHMSRRDPA